MISNYEKPKVILVEEVGPKIWSPNQYMQMNLVECQEEEKGYWIES